MPRLVVSDSVNTWEPQAVWRSKYLGKAVKCNIEESSYMILMTNKLTHTNQISSSRGHTSDLMVRISLVIESMIDLQITGEKNVNMIYSMKAISPSSKRKQMLTFQGFQSKHQVSLWSYL